MLPWAATGTGPPVVVLSGLWITAGVDNDRFARSILSPVRSLADRRRLYALNRWAGLPGDLTMAGLAEAHAAAFPHQHRVHVGQRRPGNPVRRGGTAACGPRASGCCPDREVGSSLGRPARTGCGLVGRNPHPRHARCSCGSTGDAGGGGGLRSRAVRQHHRGPDTDHRWRARPVLRHRPLPPDRGADSGLPLAAGPPPRTSQCDAEPPRSCPRGRFPGQPSRRTLMTGGDGSSRTGATAKASSSTSAAASQRDTHQLGHLVEVRHTSVARRQHVPARLGQGFEDDGRRIVGVERLPDQGAILRHRGV